MITPVTTKLSLANKTLLYKTISEWRPHSDNYEDSWGYIIQATRHGGFQWYEPDSGSLVFFGTKSQKDPTLVVPNFFATPQDLSRIVKAVQDKLNAPGTILKNINIIDTSSFTPYGFRAYTEDESWSSLARYDDQTYPQLIVDLKKTIKHEGRDFHPLRKALKKQFSLSIRPYHENDKIDVLTIFSMKDNTSKAISEQTKGMYYESHAMYLAAALEKFVIIDYTNTILGFTAYSKITSDTAAFVASLFKPNDGDISIWGQYLTLLEMDKKGFKTVNFGGNESKGAYQFVCEKFRPIREIPKTHLIYSE